MAGEWDALNARCRGLAGHLLDPQQLRTLARAKDVTSELARLIRGDEGLTKSPSSLDEVLHRATARQLTELSRWSVTVGQLAVLFAEEDRRNLRILLRGTAQRVSPAIRAAGLLATPSLPAATLIDLAAAASPIELVDRLAATRHPFAAALQESVRSRSGGLLAIELALARSFAGRARRLARAAQLLADYARGCIDLENTWTLLLWDGGFEEIAVDELFLPGGTAFSPASFSVAVRLQPAERRRAVAELFRGTGLEAVFADESTAASALEAHVLAAQIDAQHRAARLDPLGAAPCLLYVMRLRAQAWNLRRILWGRTLSIPPASIEAELVAA